MGSDKQCGSKLGTTQLFPAATVPRNAEQQLEAAPEDAPEAAPRLNVPPLEDKWTASNRLLPAHADGTFGAAGAPARGTLPKQTTDTTNAYPKKQTKMYYVPPRRREQLN